MHENAQISHANWEVGSEIQTFPMSLSCFSRHFPAESAPLFAPAKVCSRRSVAYQSIKSSKKHPVEESTLPSSVIFRTYFSIKRIERCDLVGRFDNVVDESASQGKVTFSPGEN